jgi:hypothetical protein
MDAAGRDHLTAAPSSSAYAPLSVADDCLLRRFCPRDGCSSDATPCGEMRRQVAGNSSPLGSTAVPGTTWCSGALPLLPPPPRRSRLRGRPNDEKPMSDCIAWSSSPMRTNHSRPAVVDWAVLRVEEAIGDHQDNDCYITPSALFCVFVFECSCLAPGLAKCFRRSLRIRCSSSCGCRCCCRCVSTPHGAAPSPARPRAGAHGPHSRSAAARGT